MGQLATASAAHKRSFLGFEVAGFEMRQRTFEQMASFEHLCGWVLPIRIFVYIRVYTLQLLSKHQSYASFPVDFISRLCEVCQKCVGNARTVFPFFTPPERVVGQTRLKVAL